MPRSIPSAVLALALLALGGVAGIAISSVERPHDDDTPAQPLVAAPPTAARQDAPPVPMLAGDGSATERRVEALEASVDALREERDRLAAEVATLREQAARWEAFAPFVDAFAAGNEAAAIATARNVISAQAQVQATGKIDADGDGTGEYGGFLEMSGAIPGRMANGRPMVPPVLSGAFRTLTEGGEAQRNGYLYRVYLPDVRGDGVGETLEGFDARRIDADLAETTWCLYAWPMVPGMTGNRTFFVNQGGDVFATTDPRYAGPGKGPAPDAAFSMRGIAGATTDPRNDGAVWVQVN
jgi:hypothetical protein